MSKQEAGGSRNREVENTSTGAVSLKPEAEEAKGPADEGEAGSGNMVASAEPGKATVPPPLLKPEPLEKAPKVKRLVEEEGESLQTQYPSFDYADNFKFS